ncbi:hypothetical protein [Tychonema sp. LEGE 07203]|uniref:hypothetical protein n=1 Tax=Tychonema sp. LEGE 07203 TaxID=1828671 RepID=UPI0018823B1C|nr:hypothetical protein [Tychonema sp. LEGE 07203]MBE9096122.1 hypothetical protein [Tychonema sp. LEGE 07203]
MKYDCIEPLFFVFWDFYSRLGGQCFVVNTLRWWTRDSQSIVWLTEEKVLRVDIAIALLIFGQDFWTVERVDRLLDKTCDLV